MLQDFVPGAPLENSDFVSFTYNGSSLIDKFTVTQSNLFEIFGTLDNDGRVATNFFFLSWDPGTAIAGCSANNCALFVRSDGFWNIDDDDVGINGKFSVPEPATLALIGLGLVGIAASRRRKQT